MHHKVVKVANCSSDQIFSKDLCQFGDICVFIKTTGNRSFYFKFAAKLTFFSWL